MPLQELNTCHLSCSQPLLTLPLRHLAAFMGQDSLSRAGASLTLPLISRGPCGLACVGLESQPAFPLLGHTSFPSILPGSSSIHIPIDPARWGALPTPVGSEYPEKEDTQGRSCSWANRWCLEMRTPSLEQGSAETPGPGNRTSLGGRMATRGRGGLRGCEVPGILYTWVKSKHRDRGRGGYG